MTYYSRRSYRRMNPKKLTDKQKLLKTQMNQARVLVDIFTRGLSKHLESYEYDSIEDYETLEKLVQGDLRNAIYLAESTRKAYYDSFDKKVIDAKFVQVGRVRTKKKASKSKS